MILTVIWRKPCLVKCGWKCLYLVAILTDDEDDVQKVIYYTTWSFAVFVGGCTRHQDIDLFDTNQLMAKTRTTDDFPMKTPPKFCEISLARFDHQRVNHAGSGCRYLLFLDSRDVRVYLYIYITFTYNKHKPEQNIENKTTLLNYSNYQIIPFIP